MRKRTCYKNNATAGRRAFHRVLYVCPKTERTTRGEWYIYGENYFGVVSGSRKNVDHYRRIGDYLETDGY